MFRLIFCLLPNHASFCRYAAAKYASSCRYAFSVNFSLSRLQGCVHFPSEFLVCLNAEILQARFWKHTSPCRYAFSKHASSCRYALSLLFLQSRLRGVHAFPSDFLVWLKFQNLHRLANTVTRTPHPLYSITDGERQQNINLLAITTEICTRGCFAHGLHPTGSHAKLLHFSFLTSQTEFARQPPRSEREAVSLRFVDMPWRGEATKATLTDAEHHFLTDITWSPLHFSASSCQTKLATTTEDLRERLFHSGACQKLVFHHGPPSGARLTNAEHHSL